MTEPRVTRPSFPKGYVANPKGLLSWSEVRSKLVEARHYWLGTVSPHRHPHAVPLWGVWVEDHFYFDGSPETRHARNIAANASVTVHLESGEKPVILEGTARPLKPSPELARQLSQQYALKYAPLGYAPAPYSWDSGGLYEITPRTIIAWNSFTDDPTKFIFE